MPAQPILLISTGRTGTKFFANLFDTYGEGVCGYHAPPITRYLNIVGNFRYIHGLPKSLTGFLVHTLKTRSIQQTTCRYFESNPYYLYLLDILDDTFPDIHYVYMVREPASFVKSCVTWEYDRRQSQLANRYLPYWQPMPYGEHLKGIRPDLYQRVDFYAQVWVRKNQFAFDYFSNHPRTKYLLYEDVFQSSQGYHRLVELFEWLQLDFAPPLPEDILAKKINRSHNKASIKWNDRCLDIVASHCQTLWNELAPAMRQ